MTNHSVTKKFVGKVFTISAAFPLSTWKSVKRKYHFTSEMETLFCLYRLLYIINVTGPVSIITTQRRYRTVIITFPRNRDSFATARTQDINLVTGGYNWRPNSIPDQVERNLFTFLKAINV